MRTINIQAFRKQAEVTIHYNTTLLDITVHGESRQEPQVMLCIAQARICELP